MSKSEISTFGLRVYIIVNKSKTAIGMENLISYVESTLNYLT